ncbi:hypothetical protein BHM03_00035189 [Ensete ventricosum]|uniref:Uncharacterized protein n=1 Tax=Ensete ventricosum TaxID=4639 RepID=A0A445MJC1_ENSVE|nr:hypothetical protein BHM03_00035189 [Ensete ventricosum]
MKDGDHGEETPSMAWREMGGRSSSTRVTVLGTAFKSPGERVENGHAVLNDSVEPCGLAGPSPAKVDLKMIRESCECTCKPAVGGQECFQIGTSTLGATLAQPKLSLKRFMIRANALRTRLP